MNVENLIKLAEHLEQSDNPYFNYSSLQDCALAECVVVWDDKWEYRNGYLRLVGLDLHGHYMASHFFNLTKEEVYHLFYPLGQNVTKFGGSMLDSKSTAKEVASNIRSFISNRK